MEWVALVLTLIVFAILVMVLMDALNPPVPISERELDEISCEQMRDSGWSEKEIEDFMGNHNGYYHEGKN